MWRGIARLSEIQIGVEIGKQLEAAFDRVIAIGYDQKRAVVALYARGRVFAHRGDENSARQDLRAALLDPASCDRLRAAAQASLDKLGGWRRLKLDPLDISIMMLPGEAYRYQGMLSP